MSAPREDESVGEEFISALAERDFARLEACLHADARLRALVPSGQQEHQGSTALAARFQSWFSEPASLEVLERNAGAVVDRLHLRYRFRERYSDGESEIIQQEAFCRVEQGKITSMDLLCSGHRPESPSPVATTHPFDAGEMGCGSGLPEEFRRRIQEIPIGSALEVVTKDPSAKEDLPSLARLLGHRVRSVRSDPGGATVVTVERGR